MGDAREKAEHDPPEEAKVLPAREALSLISGRPSDGDEDEEGSGGGEGPVADDDRSVERAGAEQPPPPET
jgi:hypothetical protein